MTSWDLGELRKIVRKRPADSSDGLKVLRSVGRSLEIVDYHVLHARHAATETVADNDAERLRLFAAVMGALDEQHLHDDAMLVSQAHTVACMHATRNATDIFAQLVNLLLLDQLIAVEDCDIHRVARKVRERPACAPLASALDQLLDLHWSKYVAAYTNTSKHRRLVDHSFRVSFEEGGVTGVRIGGFAYSKRGRKAGDKGVWESYGEYPVREVLGGVIEVRNRSSRVVWCLVHWSLNPHGCPATRRSTVRRAVFRSRSHVGRAGGAVMWAAGAVRPAGRTVHVRRKPANHRVRYFA